MAGVAASALAITITTAGSIFSSPASARCRLYRNQGDGTFEQVAERAGVASPGWSAGAAFFDADGDGDLDLYVAHYIEATFDEVLAARRTSTWREKVKVMAGPFGLRGGKDRSTVTTATAHSATTPRKPA